MGDWKWLTAGGLLIVSLGGCGQGPSIQAVTLPPPAMTEGAVVVAGTHLAPSRTYDVGVNTFWAPQLVRSVRTDAAGNVAQTRVEYSCAAVLGAPVNVGFYREDGLEVAQTQVYQSCPEIIQMPLPVAHPEPPAGTYTPRARG
jgi:hypothetical protein